MTTRAQKDQDDDMESHQPVLILSNASSEMEAQKLGKILLEERLIASVNIIPGVQSFYWWLGDIASSREWMMLMKTIAARTSEVIERLAQLHSYQVPGILVIPIADGFPAYLEWILESVGGNKNPAGP